MVKKFQGKQHLERAQPSSRKRFGLLEKKQDYKQRAADYHRKQKTLKNLRIKSSLRNEDEFYHGMIRGKLNRQGVHISGSSGNAAVAAVNAAASAGLSQDQKALIDSRDSAYVNAVRMHDLKVIERMQEQLILPKQDTKPEIKGKGKTTSLKGHVFFAEDEEEAQQSASSTSPVSEEQQKDRFVLAPSDPGSLNKLAKLKQRVEQLQQVDRVINLKKSLTERGVRKHKIGTDSLGIPIFKWDQQRKR